MDRQDKQLEHILADLAFDDTPNRQHRNTLEQRLLTKLSESPQRRRGPALIWRLLMRNRITQLATAATIAVAVLVPLSYATSDYVRGLIAGSYAKDSTTGVFELDKDIWIKLEIGTKEQPQIITATNVRFFVEDGQLRGSLRYDAMAWPDHTWQTTIELLDAQGHRLSHCAYVRSGDQASLPRREHNPSFPCAIRFSAGPAENVTQINQFRIAFKEVSSGLPVTPDAWVTSNALAVVHGQITDANGEPVPGATVQIREQRRPGQTGIAAPDVQTDQQGFYSYDQIHWPYTVGAYIYQPTPSGRGYRHQYQGWKMVHEGSRQVDFSFGPFPEGSATLSGIVTEPNGVPTPEFTVDARLQIGWDDESADYRYTYGHREPVASPDGHFEIPGLAEGQYRVMILSKAARNAGGVSVPRNYTCQLHPGQVTLIGQQNAGETIWYGRVLFEDGSPAVSEASGYSVQVVAWSDDAITGRTVGTADSDGYFAAVLDDKTLERLQSGQAYLTVAIAPTHPFVDGPQGEKFPLELLSADRGLAATVTIKRPKFYYGRILYENGKPAVLPASPWPGGATYIKLLDQRQASLDSPSPTPAFKLDRQGYFTAYLNDDTLEGIRVGYIQMTIYHPSYVEEWTSCSCGQYPLDMLTTDKAQAETYALSFAEMRHELAGVERNLDSGYRMQTLADVLGQYAAENEQPFPGSSETIAAAWTETTGWTQDIEYFPPGTAMTEPAETVLAYDRALLEATGMTHVLFADGHLEFCRPRRLEVLGIHGPNAAVSR